MIKYIVFATILILSISIGRAQTSLTDSIHSLKAVEIKKNRTGDNNIGARVSQLNATIVEANSTQTLGTLLNDNSLIYIRSMGQGGVATSSFRGTSSSHTQVNWNGITINPASNGSFDFSLFPTFFTDDVALYHGNNYQKNGSGALGGSINLNNTDNRINWGENKLHSTVLTEIGAFKTYTGGIKTTYTTNRLYSNTRLYYQDSENDFKYENRVFSATPYKEHRKNAQYTQFGIMQELRYKLSENDQLYTNIWYMDNKNHLPQPLIADITFPENTRNKNLRSIINYKGAKGKNNYNFSAAYLLNNYHYQKNDLNTTNIKDKSNSKTHSFITKADYSYQISPDIFVSASLNYKYELMHMETLAKSHSNTSPDGNKLSQHRNTASFQSNMLWKISNPLDFNIQVMGELNDHKFTPTYSAGISYELIKNSLFIQSSTAYNYHYPTLNDMYNHNGNTTLKAEKGFSYDATINFNTDISERLYFKASASYYTMTIHDWIIWLRLGGNSLAQPQNVDKVLAHGAEITTETSLHTGSLWHRLFLNYAYSPSRNKSKGTFESDKSYNKQLPYIPEQKWNAKYLLKVKDFSLSYGISYTGKRYVTPDSEKSTPSSLIHDAQVGYLLHFNQNYKVQLKLRIDNLFDEYYESTKYYPMSLRSWYVSAQFTF